MVTKIYGYAGKILRVNLSNGEINTENTMKSAKRFIGGRGVNQWLMFSEVKQSVWPFDSANKIVFGTGPLVGTAAPASGRYTVASKNAFTGGVGSANSGGFFGPELKYAGYDHIVIQGRNRYPCYIWIDDDLVKVMDAPHLWGKTTWETDDIIRKELGDKDVQIASIGPAGENLVRSACIVNNGGRVAGKCGLGAIMGSKNLKAVAVRGTGEIEVARPEEFMHLVERAWEKLGIRHKKQIKGLGRIGVHEIWNEFSGNPVRNFQDGFWDPDKIRKTSQRKLISYSTRKLACHACPMPCSYYLKVPSGEFAGVEGEGYYANTVMNFGCKLDVDNLPAIIQMHMLCSQYGLDVDATAGAIAWAMECYEKGILNKEDTGEMDLDWGDYQVVLGLIRKIAFRDGFGDLLAEGSKRASEIVGRGSEKYAMHIKGQDLFEPLRTQVAWAFGTIVSPRGGGHLRGAPTIEYKLESDEVAKNVYGILADRRSYEGKVKLVVWTENFKAVIDSLIICCFITERTSPQTLSPEDCSRLLSAATGWDVGVNELMEMGERIHNIEKAINVRAGFTRKDDAPPNRFFEPIRSGPGRGERLSKEKFEEMLDEYYGLRGWEANTGLPTKQKLEEIGLRDVAAELQNCGKLECLSGERPKSFNTS